MSEFILLLSNFLGSSGIIKTEELVDIKNVLYNMGMISGRVLLLLLSILSMYLNSGSHTIESFMMANVSFLLSFVVLAISYVMNFLNQTDDKIKKSIIQGSCISIIIIILALFLIYKVDKIYKLELLENRGEYFSNDVHVLFASILLILTAANELFLTLNVDKMTILVLTIVRFIITLIYLLAVIFQERKITINLIAILATLIWYGYMLSNQIPLITTSKT